MNFIHIRTQSMGNLFLGTYDKFLWIRLGLRNSYTAVTADIQVIFSMNCKTPFSRHHPVAMPQCSDLMIIKSTEVL